MTVHSEGSYDLTTGFEDAALAVLRRALGPSAEFRDGQLEAIEAIATARL